MANTLYIDLANGSNTTGTGSAQSPLLTIAAAVSLLGGQPGTLNVQGICRTPVSITGAQGLVIQPWKDAAPLQFRLDRPISGPWTAVGGGSFTVNIGTGKNVVGVVKGFETNVTRYGQHYGYLVPAADANGTQTQGTWFYDPGTGLLYVNVDSTNPGADVMWCEGGANALTLSNCQDCIVDRFVGYNALDPTPGLGYLFIGSGSRNILRIDNIDGYGYHAAGFVAGGGLVNQDNVIEGTDRALIAGCNVGTSSATTLVHYQFDTNTAANAVGRNLDIRLNHILKLDQTQVRADRNLTALYSHSQTGNRFAGVVWSNIRVYQDLAATGTRSIADAGDTAVPSNLTDASQYDVRIVNCQGYGLARATVTASHAYVGCMLRFDRTGATATDADRMAFDPRGNSTSKALLLSGCDIGANLDVASGNPTILRGWTNFKLCAVNSTFNDTGAGNAGDRSIITSVNGTSEELRFHKCAFGYAVTTSGLRRLVRNDTYAANAGTRVFDNCAYIRISTFSSQATIDTQAEWSASVDTGLLAIASNPFEDQTIVSKPTRASTLYTTVNRTSGIKADGVFGQPNGGRIGAWQFGQMPGVTYSGDPVRTDLPICFFGLFGNTGPGRNNDRGYANGFFDDPYGWLKPRLQRVIGLGIRHVCIAHWHGQTVTGDFVNDSDYYTGNPERDGVPLRARNGILRLIDENPDIQFSLYICPFPRNKSTSGLVPRQRMYDMAGEDGYESFKEFVELWARPNLRLFWSDAVGAAVDENITDGTFNIATVHDGNRAKFESIGLKMGGEVWPQSYSPLGYRAGQADRGPWLNLGANVGIGEDLLTKETARGTQYIVNDPVPGDGYHYIPVGPGTTVEMVQTLRDRGLIVGTSGEQSDEVIRFIAQAGDGQPATGRRPSIRRSLLRSIVSLDMAFGDRRDTFERS